MHNGGFRCARGCGGAITVAPGCIFLGRRDLRNGVYVYFGRSAGPRSDWNVSVAKPVSGAAIGACGGIIICGGFAAAMLFFAWSTGCSEGLFHTCLIKSVLYRPSLPIVSNTMSLYFHGRRKRTGFLQRR